MAEAALSSNIENTELSGSFWDSVVSTAQGLQRGWRVGVDGFEDAIGSTAGLLIGGIPSLINEAPRLFGNNSFSMENFGVDWSPVSDIENWFAGRQEIVQEFEYGEAIKPEGFVEGAIHFTGGLALGASSTLHKAKTATTAFNTGTSLIDDAAKVGLNTADEAASSLGLIEKYRVMYGPQSLAARIHVLASHGEGKLAQDLLQKAGRLGMSGDDYMHIVNSSSKHITPAIKTMAKSIFEGDIVASGLTNAFRHAGRTASYIMNQPGQAAMGALQSIGSAIASPIQTFYSLKNSTMTAAKWILSGTAATVATDLYAFDGAGTEMIADQLDEGVVATGLYTAVNMVNPETVATKGRAHNKDSRGSANTITNAFSKVKDTTADIAENMGLTGKTPSTEDSFAWLKKIPGGGALAWFFEKIVNLYNAYIKPLFSGANNSNLRIQGGQNRLSKVMQKSGHELDTGASAKLISHKGKDLGDVTLNTDKQQQGLILAPTVQ